MPLRNRQPPAHAVRAALDLPPPFRLVTLREVGDAFAHATAVAAEEGAGTLVYVGRFDLAEFAVVLEPDEPLRTARRALLCRARRARRCARRARAARKADHLRLAGRDPGRWRARRRRAPRLAAGRRRGRAAAVARVRRHDPHRRDGRGGAGPASARRPRSRRKVSTISAPAGWSRALRAISWSRSTPGRRRDLPRWRRTISRGWRRRRACAATSTTTAISWCGAWAGKVERRALVPALAAPSWLDPATGGTARVKLLRTIRLDPSDTFVFERAAEPGEWAVSGGPSCLRTPTRRGARRQAARGLPRRIPGRRLARLVDAGADRGGERAGSRRVGRDAGEAIA